MSRTIGGYKKKQPDTLFELSRMLETNDLYKQIFLQEILTDDGEAIALLLGSKNLLNNIKTAESLTIDGSFRVKINNLLKINNFNTNIGSYKLLFFYLLEYFLRLSLITVFASKARSRSTVDISPTQRE